MPKPLTHRIKHWMLRDRVKIVVVGCGGTGPPWSQVFPTCITHCWRRDIRPELWSV